MQQRNARHPKKCKINGKSVSECKQQYAQEYTNLGFQENLIHFSCHFIPSHLFDIRIIPPDLPEIFHL